MILASWTAHPAARRPQDLALVGAVTAITLWAVLISFESFFLTGLAGLFLVAAVSPFLFPTHYKLTDWGVEERRLFRQRGRKWGDLRRYQLGSKAALVSPLAKASVLDRYRGIILLLDGADRAQVMAILEERIDAR